MSGIDIKPDAQGKVRDIYDLGDKLLMVATDRISAFDYILEDEIPHKGAVLTQISLFWLEQLKDVIGNHLISADVADLLRRGREFASQTFDYFETYTVIALVYLIITLLLSKGVSMMEGRLTYYDRDRK